MALAPLPRPVPPHLAMTCLLLRLSGDVLTGALHWTTMHLFNKYIAGQHIVNRSRFQPVEDPATHCQLARAVDAFEAAAWFWSSVEAWLEDNEDRASDSSDDAAASPAAASASSPVADANDPAYVTLAAGVDAMDLDDVAGDVGSEMEVDG